MTLAALVAASLSALGQLPLLYRRLLLHIAAVSLTSHILDTALASVAGTQVSSFLFLKTLSLLPSPQPLPIQPLLLPNHSIPLSNTPLLLIIQGKKESDEFFICTSND